MAAVFKIGNGSYRIHYIIRGLKNIPCYSSGKLQIVFHTDDPSKVYTFADKVDSLMRIFGAKGKNTIRLSDIEGALTFKDIEENSSCFTENVRNKLEELVKCVGNVIPENYTAEGRDLIENCEYTGEQLANEMGISVSTLTTIKSNYLITKETRDKIADAIQSLKNKESPEKKRSMITCVAFEKRNNRYQIRIRTSKDNVLERFTVNYTPAAVDENIGHDEVKQFAERIKNAIDVAFKNKPYRSPMLNMECIELAVSSGSITSKKADYLRELVREVEKHYDGKAAGHFVAVDHELWEKLLADAGEKPIEAYVSEILTRSTESSGEMAKTTEKTTKRKTRGRNKAPVLMTISEAAERYRISEHLIRTEIKNGNLKAISSGEKRAKYYLSDKIIKTWIQGENK